MNIQALAPLFLGSLVFFLGPLACRTVNSQSSAAKVISTDAVKMKDWPTVVGIANVQKHVYCTGTAITPTLVITAAHCLLPQYNNPHSLYIGNGSDKDDIPQLIPIEKFKVRLEFPTLDGYDFGYIQLSKPLPFPSGDYIDLLSDPKEIELVTVPKQSVRVVSYGYRETGSTELYGLKFETNRSIIAKPEGELTYDPKRGDFLLSNTKKGKDYICQGESGGPVFVKGSWGSWKQLGISTANNGTECEESSFSVNGLLARNLCWVQKTSGVNLKLAKDYCSSMTNPAEDYVDAQFELDAANQRVEDAIFAKSKADDAITSNPGDVAYVKAAEAAAAEIRYANAAVKRASAELERAKAAAEKAAIPEKL
jgi:hypothetical protein